MNWEDNWPLIIVVLALPAFFGWMGYSLLDNAAFERACIAKHPGAQVVKTAASDTRICGKIEVLEVQ